MWTGREQVSGKLTCHASGGHRTRRHGPLKVTKIERLGENSWYVKRGEVKLMKRH